MWLALIKLLTIAGRVLLTGGGAKRQSLTAVSWPAWALLQTVNPACFLLVEWSRGACFWLVARTTEVAKSAARGRTTSNLTSSSSDAGCQEQRHRPVCKQTEWRTPVHLSRNGRRLHLAGFWQSSKQKINFEGEQTESCEEWSSNFFLINSKLETSHPSTHPQEVL